ncbi:PKD domain-containing protein [Streptomyces sp. NL15-2K]|uniref:PKD domain-containing protein n=1 Tax=Streptomyces sp. NL15-2K TaxID=376149 RepID=UPI00209C05B2|nr:MULTISPECIES: PKD domain-containing protein [Actinomycetes]WKX15437.1 PKD domain-containing protein [Kutzneria buriramensis]
MGASAGTLLGAPAAAAGGWSDPDYDRPVIDRDEDRTSPVRHRRVSGHFEGTSARFSIYLPPRDRWRGRFFQLVYPLQDEHATDRTIAFGADSGAYTVQTNGGVGYRVDASAAEFARTVAASHYDWRGRIHGYIYGASGGSYQTIGAMEKTTGIWDGAVPIVIGVPTSIPNTFTARALARFVLRDKAARIADAVRPGGSGDPYEGLDGLERAVLREVTLMGLPLRAWEDYPYALGLSDPQGLLGLGSTVRAMDPSYADDFWSLPGYLGTDPAELGERFRAARVDRSATVTRVDRDEAGEPKALVLDGVPPGTNATGLDFTAYGAGPLTGSLDPASGSLTLGEDNADEVLKSLKPGSRIRVDNRWFLALHSYHRHQIPARAGYTAWNQYQDADGKPLHPQRSIEVGPAVSESTSGGGTHTGRPNGKLIIVDNLLDADAFPWHADWYATRAREALGERYDDTVRVWYNDHADHQMDFAGGKQAARLVDYMGIVQQALRDVSAWAERGVAPARSTRYAVSGGQVAVAGEAGVRRGIQPVVDLTVAGGDRIEVPAGRTVGFRARIVVPPGAGRIVAVEWDFTGNGDFTAHPVGPARPVAEVRATHTYREPGTYFPVLRATAQRAGDSSTESGRVQNLGRVRVVVRAGAAGRADA